ncbi:MAG: pyridoxamine 5'-phosphate oxidase family protein [Acidimicrobiia bacterium]
MSSYGLEILSREDCDALLRTQRIGRIGVCSGRPGVFPVVYGLLDSDVVFRTAPGEKLIAAALHREIVFEIDSYDLDSRTGWSVNVFGSAEEIAHPVELARAEALDLPAWAGEIRDRYVRIKAIEVSGRRIAATSRAVAHASSLGLRARDLPL